MSVMRPAPYLRAAEQAVRRDAASWSGLSLLRPFIFDRPAQHEIHLARRSVAADQSTHFSDWQHWQQRNQLS